MSLKPVTRTAVTALSALALVSLNTGCETGAGNAGVTAGLSTFAINMLTGHDLVQSAASGMIAGTTTFFVVRSYEASLDQQRIAYVRGERAVQRVVVRRKVEVTHTRVIAVRVPKKQGTAAGGTDVMLVSASTGRPQSDKVYVVNGSPDDGSEVTIQGTRAVFSGNASN